MYCIQNFAYHCYSRINRNFAIGKTAFVSVFREDFVFWLLCCLQPISVVDGFCALKSLVKQPEVHNNVYEMTSIFHFTTLKRYTTKQFVGMRYNYGMIDTYLNKKFGFFASKFRKE